LEGYKTVGVCVDVYDGDSCKVVFPSPDNSKKSYRWTLRMKGYDAPEVRGRTKELGYHARDILRDHILGRRVFVDCFESDKYGRILATVHTINTDEKTIGWCVNDWMLENVPGVYAYDGGRRRTSTEIMESVQPKYLCDY